MTLKTLQLSNSSLNVAYQDVGHGEPLVLIHGVGMQSAAWKPQIDTVSKQFRVIAIDMPGHGQSSALPETSELKDYIDWLHTVLTELDLTSVNLAGHSMGGMIAGGYVMTYPSMVRRVAVLNAVHKRSLEARTAVEARALEIREGKIDLETPLQRWFGNSTTDVKARKSVAMWLKDVNLSGYATAYNAFAKGDKVYADGWAEVVCPMLALTGDGDPNSTPEMAKAMASEAQDGDAKILSGHRHMVNLTAPDEVSQILLEWLKRPVKRKDV